jgi:glycolate oxidase iron-sulfur subunit
MQTSFSEELLRDPDIQYSESAIRKCVHCGFCTATCPTYVLLGDERDSPRGRIYLIKDMLENQRQPSQEVVRHIDRCLSCLACTTTCPSDVNYMHLIDHARAYIAHTYRRPWLDRFYRALLARLLPYPDRFRLALRLAPMAKPVRGLLRKIGPLRPLAAMLDLAPTSLQRPQAICAPDIERPRARVIILRGCAEPVLRPSIRSATVRLLNRFKVAIVEADGEVCCGALVHHMGREEAALAAARRNIDVWWREVDGDGLDAIVITTSGCGTSIKNYAHMLRSDPAYAAKAQRISELAADVSEFLPLLQLPTLAANGVTLAYHAACSLQHGQKVLLGPVELLEAAGFAVKTPTDSHLCCGSAGTYNILQPGIAEALGDRKARSIDALEPDMIATGNLGCAIQITRYASRPVIHTVELLDWAYGGPQPAEWNSNLGAKD